MPTNILVLLLGLAVAVSPIPILAVMLVLMSPGRKANGLAFLIGWIGSLIVVSLLLHMFTSAFRAALDQGLPTWAEIIKIGVGAALILLAVGAWRQSRNREEGAKLPRWASAVDDMKPHTSLLLGGFLGAVGVKNPLLCLAATAIIAKSGMRPMGMLLSWLLFIGAASVSIAIPVFYALFGGERAANTLERWRGWIEMHGYFLTSIVFLGMGILLVTTGLMDLLAAG